MRRILTLAAIILVPACLLAGGPYLAGVKAEELLRARLADQALGSIRVQEYTYRRAWWTSTIHARLAIGTGPAFEISIAVRHGPVDYRALGDGRWGDAFALAALETAEPYAGAVRAAIGLNGTAHILASINEKAFFTAPGVRLDVGALEADLRCPPAEESCIGTTQARGLKLIGDAGHLSAGELGVRAESSAPGAQARRIRVAGLEFVRTDRASPPVRIGDLRLDYDSTTNGGQMTGALAARLEELQVAGSSVQSAVLEASAQRIAVDALPEARLAVARYGLARGKAGQETRALLKMWQALGPLLNPRPDLEIGKLVLVSADGAARGAARLGVRSVPLADDPASLLGALDGAITLSFPAPMLEGPFAGEVRAELARMESTGKIPPLTADQRDRSVSAAAGERAAAWAAQHYLRRAGPDYRLDVVLRNGRLRINGEPMEFLP